LPPAHDSTGDGAVIIEVIEVDTRNTDFS
jgi:hypothetical protein